ncbi:PREDICTED: caspase-6-like [Nicrophorus vespilloides]|uniref:Caspase-6-like n=1 Tax=Nicrophorus vespilloides TaxID=110193 RepID=A0ABM1NHK1_NICVS|nr:PREDICTED: caspase-6-like [Nicrophorus vespilloides]
MATRKDVRRTFVTTIDYEKFGGRKPQENDVEETETLEFEEKNHEYEDGREYPRKEKEQGMIVIFNQISFDGLDRRSGSEVDEKRIIRTFNRLYFNIKRKFIFRDLNRKEMLDKIDEICAGTYSVNCLICVVMTHGGAHNTLYLRDGHIFAYEIYEKFCACESFKNIPKLFLFQACKTFTDDLQTVDHSKQTKLVDGETWKHLIPPDTMLFYSSLEGEVSFRVETEGSWFIQELCNNIDSHGRDEDMHSLATRVIKCVACNYYFEEETETKKQMPIFLSTLTKKFYLTMSKRRQNMLMKLAKIRNIS